MFATDIIAHALFAAALVGTVGGLAVIDFILDERKKAQ